MKQYEKDLVRDLCFKYSRKDIADLLPTTVQDKILGAFLYSGKPLTVADVQEIVGPNVSSVGNQVSALAVKGYVECIGSKGRCAVYALKEIK